MFARSLALAALVSLTAPAASAGSCPTGADLGKGIRLTDSRSKTDTTFRRTPDYLIETRRGGTAGSKGAQTTWYVNGLTPGATDRNGYETRFVYQGNPAPKLARLGKGRNSADARFRLISRGAEIDRGSTRYTYEGKGEVKISGCVYEVLKVRTDTKLASGARYIWRQYYAPEIDINLRSEKLSEQGRPLSAVAYDRIMKAR